jgi:hypothetical protein
MYLRVTQRHNRGGSSVTYYALAESVWNAEAKRREAHVVHSFGRADQLDQAELARLVRSINQASMTVMTRPAVRRHPIVGRSRSSGCVRTWRGTRRPRTLGRTRHRHGHPQMRRTGQADRATRDRAVCHGRQPPRRPGLQPACAERWLADITWLPDAAGLAVDQCYRALDFLAVWADEIEREVFLKAADLFRLAVDLIFYDTTTAYFEIDEADENEQQFAGRLYAPLRKRGHSKEGRDNQPR